MDLSPLTASLWAETIVRHWQAGARPESQRPRPLQILDLAPARPVGARRLLHALSERIAGSHGARPGENPVRYFACATDGALPHECDDPHDVGWQPQLPFAVLARHSLSRLEQRLLAIHYGKCMEADLDRLGMPHGDSGDAWAPVCGSPWGPSLDETMASCRANLNSAPVPLPVGALRLIGQLAARASSGFLWLAIDEGLASEQAMRSCRFDDVESSYRRQNVLPVNFHFLAEHFRRSGAAAWQRETDLGRVVQIAVYAPPDTAAQPLLDRVVAPLAHAPALDTAALAQAMRTVVARGDAVQALCLLRMAHFDPAVFAGAGPALHRRLLPQPGCDRAAWADALARVWTHCGPASDTPLLEQELAAAAARVAAWGLARRVLSSCMEFHGAQATTLTQLAWCDMSTGRSRAARDLLTQALACNPRLEPARQLATRLDARTRRWAEGQRVCLCHSTPPITLEPLDADHAEALLHQYRDPQIAVMASLPKLGDVESMTAWIDRTAMATDRHSFVVAHRDAGVVGYVGLRVSGSTANFCFWMGADHQGKGFAAPSGHLLCDFGWTLGIDWIFATAFSDNTRSIRALERIGFTPLSVRVAGNADPRTFLYLARIAADPASALEAFAAHMRQKDEALRLLREDGSALAASATADATPQ